MLRKVPLIVILGSTGTGKTKLSLELAERFGGEIISADSMQVYANLDIATAKATKEERSQIRHHLLDVATPAEPFTVVDFRNKALPVIEQLLSESKCPIVVGGTNYYIESLLWDILVSSDEEKRKSEDATEASSSCDNSSPEKRESEKKNAIIASSQMLSMPSETLHSHLRQIDPETANRLHPNNKRKIMRAIEFYQQTGRTLSSKLKEQRQQPGGNRLGGPLRYPHTILFWLRCNQDILNERLDKRVDAMLEQGLLREIRAFHNKHNQNNGSEKTLSPKSAAYTKGVLQTIGFKEFIPYLQEYTVENDEKIEDFLKNKGYQMPTEEHFKQYALVKDQLPDGSLEAAATAEHLPPGLEVLNGCLNELKLVTRRYSRKQPKWINNRFLASRDRQVPDLYELDTSDVSRWREGVYGKAVTVIDCYREGRICEIEPMERRQHPGAGLNDETLKFCSICERHFVGEFEWQLHMKSNKHKRRKATLKKKQMEAPTETSSEVKDNSTATTAT